MTYEELLDNSKKIEQALKKFGIAIDKLKRIYAEAYREDSNELEIFINESNDVEIRSFCTIDYFDSSGKWVDTK